MYPSFTVRLRGLSFKQDRYQILSQPLLNDTIQNMIYIPLWNVSHILFFNCLVLGFPKDQKELTPSMPLVKSR